MTTNKLLNIQIGDISVPVQNVITCHINEKRESIEIDLVTSLSQAPTSPISLIANGILISSTKNVKTECCALKNPQWVPV